MPLWNGPTRELQNAHIAVPPLGDNRNTPHKAPVKPVNLFNRIRPLQQQQFLTELSATTLSPTLNPFTCLPTAATTPTVSWPEGQVSNDNEVCVL